MNDWSYGCLANALAYAIVRSRRSPRTLVQTPRSSEHRVMNPIVLRLLRNGAQFAAIYVLDRFVQTTKIVLVPASELIREP
jgi:hypothetical protein